VPDLSGRAAASATRAPRQAAGGRAAASATRAPRQAAGGRAAASATRAPRQALTARLPGFPWDALEPYRARARTHPAGIVDLAVGAPVDPVPAAVCEALAAASNAPGYPATAGTRVLREAAAAWLARRHQVTVDPDAVLPVIGTKELVASLPMLLGCGPGDVVVHPALAYPTYDIGARLAGATPVGADGLAWPPGPARVRWLNSPSNPTGQVLTAHELREVVRQARGLGAVVASDECYIELGWEEQPVSLLHPDACDGSHAGLLAVHSLSKRSSMAGYRAGFVTGDPELIAELLEIRKHSGLIVPAPVQAAAAAAFNDDEHADAQRRAYASRRTVLRCPLEAAGWSVTHSGAGLYLWAAHPARDGWASVAALADIGILVAPGDIFGPSGSGHIRLALTATDERIAAAAVRLEALA
jgi:succinyldiaminopimelate transaminase